MKFSLRNLLLANAILALGLSLVLQDSDSKIKNRAIKMQRDFRLIQNAKNFNQAVSQDEVQRMDVSQQAAPLVRR